MRWMRSLPWVRSLPEKFACFDWLAAPRGAPDAIAGEVADILESRRLSGTAPAASAESLAALQRGVQVLADEIYELSEHQATRICRELSHCLGDRLLELHAGKMWKPVHGSRFHRLKEDVRAAVFRALAASRHESVRVLAARELLELCEEEEEG